MKNKIPTRDYTLGIRLKPPERDYLEREANERRQTLSEYVRGILLVSMNFNVPVDKQSA